MYMCMCIHTYIYIYTYIKIAYDDRQRLSKVCTVVCGMTSYGRAWYDMCDMLRCDTIQEGTITMMR